MRTFSLTRIVTRDFSRQNISKILNAIGPFYANYLIDALQKLQNVTNPSRCTQQCFIGAIKHGSATLCLRRLFIDIFRIGRVSLVLTCTQFGSKYQVSL